MWYISSYVRMPNPNLHIVGSVATQNIHVIVCLFTATIPNLKSFLMSFDTATMMVLSARLRGITEEEIEDNLRGKARSRSRGRGKRKISNILGISMASTDYRPPTPPMIRGEVRAYNRGARGAGRDSVSFDDIELAIGLNTSHTATMHGGLGHHYYHRHQAHHDIDSPPGSREGGSLGANSEDPMVTRRDG